MIGSQGHGKSALTRTLYAAIGIAPTSHESASTSPTTEGNDASTSSTTEGNDEEQVLTSISKPTTFLLYLKKPGKDQGDNEQETSGKLHNNDLPENHAILESLHSPDIFIPLFPFLISSS
jgi:hypothetical protein